MYSRFYIQSAVFGGSQKKPATPLALRENENSFPPLTLSDHLNYFLTAHVHYLLNIINEPNIRNLLGRLRFK